MESSPDPLLKPEDAWSFLEASRRQWLEKSWAGTFRQHLLEELPIEALAKVLPKQGGRPRKDFRLILGVLILQQVHDLTDAETVEAVSFNLAWHSRVRSGSLQQNFISVNERCETIGES